MADLMTWTTPGGETILLTNDDAGYIVTPGGTTGLRSVVYSMEAQQYAGQDGAAVQSIRAEPGAPTVGLHMAADNAADFRDRARRLVRAMRPKAGVGRLTVVTPEGEARSLECYCTGGLEGDEALTVMRPGRWWRMVLKFYAPDPWWRGDARTIDTGLSPAAAFFPIFPLRLASTALEGGFTVDLSDADAPSFPRWTVTGPGSGLVLTNETTGQSIALDVSLLEGESVVIDTRPGYQSVRSGDGTNLMGSLATDPALWSLAEGVNDITVTFGGTTSASRIVGVYEPRFAGI